MRSWAAKLIAVLAGVAPVAAICAVSIAHAAGPSAQASIIGGEEAHPGQFPWLAFIVDFPGGNTAISCTGTVVAPRVVLSAGHCVLDEASGRVEDPAGFLVVTGTSNWTYPERQVSGVARVIPYPKFAPQSARDGFGDASLLVLETPTTAPKIPFETRHDSRLLRVGTHAVITGWGMTLYGQEEPTEALMWSHTVIGSDRCEGLWGRICTIDFPKATAGPCHGDSGGPLLVRTKRKRWVEVGIAEAVFGRCSLRRPQLYTRTDLLAKWIRSRIAQIEAR